MVLITAAEAKNAANVTYKDERLARIEDSLARQIEGACREWDLSTRWTGALPVALRTKLTTNGYTLTNNADHVLISWA